MEVVSNRLGLGWVGVKSRQLEVGVAHRAAVQAGSRPGKEVQRRA